MKLDVVAVDAVVAVVVEELKNRGTRNRRQTVRVGWAGFAAVFCMLTAGSAMALDGIDLSQPAEETAPGECPRLIQIKYPFLRCQNGQIGLADGNATWENSRQIPIGSHFVESDDYFGPSLNRD